MTVLSQQYVISWPVSWRKNYNAVQSYQNFNTVFKVWSPQIDIAHQCLWSNNINWYEKFSISTSILTAKIRLINDSQRLYCICRKYRDGNMESWSAYLFQYWENFIQNPYTVIIQWFKLVFYLLKTLVLGCYCMFLDLFYWPHRDDLSTTQGHWRERENTKPNTVNDDLTILTFDPNLFHPLD